MQIFLGYATLRYVYSGSQNLSVSLVGSIRFGALRDGENGVFSSMAVVVAER